MQNTSERWVDEDSNHLSAIGHVCSAITWCRIYYVPILCLVLGDTGWQRQTGPCDTTASGCRRTGSHVWQDSYYLSRNLLRILGLWALPPRGVSGKNIVLGSDQKGPVLIVRVSWLWSHGHSQKMLFLIWEQKRKGEEWGHIPLGEFLVPSLRPHSHECP